MPQETSTVPGPTTSSPAVALATLAEVTGNNDQTGEVVIVHFNPVSLQLTVSNEIKDTTKNERKQYIAKASAKLTMELIFDTTDTGDDVCATTRKIQAFVMPSTPAGKRGNPQTPPPLVLFEWGTISFKGIAENYRETLDFFSAEGVPLRATVNLTLSRQDQVFDNTNSGADAGIGGAGEEVFDAPASSAAEMANSLQNPDAARTLAAVNGQESLRFGSGQSMSISGAVRLKAPAAFSVVAADSSLVLSPASGPTGNNSMGAGWGGVASLGRLCAAEGAFSALSVNKQRTSLVQMNPEKLMSESVQSKISGNESLFTVGGRAGGSSSSGLRANVGVSGKISFDQE